MFNLWKPLVPAGMEGTWAPVQGSRAGWHWYFNDNYPWLGMLFCAPIIGLWYWCTDQYIVQRALGAPNETEARRGSISPSFLKLLPVFIFIIPGMICFALAEVGELPALEQLDRAGRTVITGQRPEGLSADGGTCAPHRRAGDCGGRAARRADELAGRCVQRLIDAVHDGLLFAPAPEASASTSWSGSDGSPRASWW